MKPCLLACAVLVFSTSALALEDDPAVKDCPSIPRFPGTVISGGSEHDFGSHDFTVKDGTKPVEGHIWEVQYALQEGKKAPSPLELSRNYGSQFKKKGGAVVFEQVSSGGGTVTMKMPAGKGETWLELLINNGGEQLTFHIVTTTPMEQKVELSAEEMGAALAATGRIALYGILFDSGKDVIKPESAAALEEILKLLKSDAALKLRIEGHTDNEGKKADNLALSKKRAEAVRKWLTGKAVAQARLEVAGLGDTQPLGPNDTSEGRAKNRRVELAKK
jgi:outer membrane protein OmpA-like peptidoglycan-associated protein